MKIELDSIIIEYNNCDLPYIDDLITSLNEKITEILNFFNFSEIKPKVQVRLWSNLNAFRENAPFPISESTCGYAYENSKIEVLSLEILKGLKYHEHEKIDNLIALIAHEFVHICHNRFSEEESYVWLWEGLATFLSHQYNKSDFHFETTLEEMKEEKNTDYREYFTMFYYVYTEYEKEYIFDLLKDFELSKKETPRLYEETKKIIKNYK